MKRRISVALCLAAVSAAAIAAGTMGATKKATASSITVWLQVDAQSAWPQSVALAIRNILIEENHPARRLMMNGSSRDSSTLTKSASRANRTASAIASVGTSPPHSPDCRFP